MAVHKAIETVMLELVQMVGGGELAGRRRKWDRLEERGRWMRQANCRPRRSSLVIHPISPNPRE